VAGREDADNWPKWIGNDIFFNDAPGGTGVFTARVTTSRAGFENGIPERLFTTSVADFDVSPDAQRFLWAVPPAQSAAQAPITVVLGWQEELKQRTATK